jgi:cysteine synthase
MKKPLNSFPFVSDAYESPRFVRLTNNLHAAVFPFMKVMTANYMVEAAIKRSQISSSKTVVLESTSGTFGYALALICKKWKIPLILVIQPDLDEALKKRLELMGAQLEVAQPLSPTEDLQVSRLRRLKELQRQYPDHYWPSQYENQDAQHAYTRLASYIIEQIGVIDTLVGPVGTGGSMCGTSKALRLMNHRLTSVGVDACNSMGFGQKAGESLLGGLGTAMPISNLDHTVFDEVHWVSDAEGFKACRELLSDHGIYAGGSSGCAFLAARWWAAKNPDRSVVVIFPDEGHRYSDTIYNDIWLRENNVWLDILPAEPISVDHPSLSPNNRWSRIKWERRTYLEVTGQLWS